MASLKYHSFLAIYDTDPDGDNVVASRSMEIRDKATGLYATIYEDSAGATPIAQPGAATDSNGLFEFYVAPGVYTISDGVITETLELKPSPIEFDTLDDAKAAGYILEGDVVMTKEFSSGNGGGGTYDVISGTGTANGYDIIAHDTLSLSFVLRKTKRLDVKKLGVIGDGVTDNSDGIQRAIDFIGGNGGGTVILTAENSDYRVSKQAGTNDKWGININYSNVVLEIQEGATLRRLSSDISTYAKAFPILLIGEPDSNLAGDQIKNVKIKGGEFIGEDTRHSNSGNLEMDGRQSIWIKNAKKVTVYGSEFSAIDSGAIYVQRPGEYDFENAAYYNTTKCYDIKVINSEFYADSHATAGRALLHAINMNVDRGKVLHNTFEWCDVCVNADTTYQDYDDVETDTFTDSNLATTVNRTGRNITVHGNNIYNSSEHALYLNTMTFSATGNTIEIDDRTTCNTNQIQVRGMGGSITGNTLTNVASGVDITTGASDITFSGNSIQCLGDPEGGAINIQSQGLTAYIDARDWLSGYTPMRNISVTGNTIHMNSASQTFGYGIRIYTDTSDANFNTDGQLQNVAIKGNIINNPRVAIFNFANLARQVKINDNTFVGKPFTEASFTTSTSMDSLAALGVDDSLSSPLQWVTFDNNSIYGFEYILYDIGGAGSAGTILPPYGVRGNNMDYIKYWDTAAFAAPGWETMFYHNQGIYFLDRTGWFSNRAINNSLSDGTSNSEKKTMIQLVSSTDVRIYHDDAGGFKAL